MILKALNSESAVLRSGYWDLELNVARPRLVSLKSDTSGLGQYGHEMLEPGFGGESVIETAGATLRSHDSRNHEISVLSDPNGAILLKNVEIGDVAVADITFALVGEKEETLRISVERTIRRPVEAVTDLPFCLQCVREFAFWSKPMRHFGHNPAEPMRAGYSPVQDKTKRRVIGWHRVEDLAEFVVHGSPCYPDLLMRANQGCHHLEQCYARHTVFGVSSGDFSAGNLSIKEGKETYILELTARPQGQDVPVAFQSGNERVNRFIPAFFDGYLLSGVAGDHEYFGNNTYRHAYCPGAIHHMTRGFLITSGDRWHDQQGLIEERWKHHIRRTFSEGMSTTVRPGILFDSGVWQDACGIHKGMDKCSALDVCFVLACCHVILKSGDKAFAEEIYGSLKAILDDIATLDTDGDGLLEAPTPGTPGTPSSSYNDAMSMGHKDGYLNAFSCEAFSLFASMSKWLGHQEVALHFDKLSEGIKMAYDKQLWNEKSGHYAGWIDIEGNAHDFWFTFTNFPAVSAGIVPEDRQRIMMRSFFGHPSHHRIFAAGLNLDPVTDGTYSQDSQFGLWLNGGVLLGPAAFELFARAVGAGGECAWEMLNDVIAQWEKDSLASPPKFMDWSRGVVAGDLKNKRQQYTGGNAYTWIDGNGATGAGTETYLSDGGAILWGIYTGIFGIRSDFQKLAIVPHVPKALADTRIDLRMLNKKVTIQYKGYGDKLKVLCHNSRKVDVNSIPWNAINDNDTVVVECE